MPAYRVEINGENFLIEMGGRVAKHGFVTTRIVEAAEPGAAEDSAVQMLRDTKRLRDLVRNEPDDPPVMDVTSIVELGSDGANVDRRPGLVWYEENPRR
jgi:hypothetical protein